MIYPYLGTGGKHPNKYLSNKHDYVSPPVTKNTGFRIWNFIKLVLFLFVVETHNGTKFFWICFFDQSFIINQTLIQKCEGFIL